MAGLDRSLLSGAVYHRGPDGRLRRLYRALVQHRLDLLIHGPGVAGGGCGMADQVEHENPALPDARALECESDRGALPKVRATAVGGLDRSMEVRDPSALYRSPGSSVVNGSLKTIVSRHGGNIVNFESVSWYAPGVALWQKTPFSEGL